MLTDKILSLDNVNGIFTEHLPNILASHELLLAHLAELRSKGLVKPGVAKAFEKLVGSQILLVVATPSKLIQPFCAKLNRSRRVRFKTMDTIL